MWAKLVGLLLLRRLLRSCSHDFNIPEFLLNSKDAIFAVVGALQATTDGLNNLSGMLENKLYKEVTKSVSSLNPTHQIDLELESINNMYLVGVSTITGKAESGDEHVINFLGQKIITSQSQMQILFDSSDGKFRMENARALGTEAKKANMEFVITISFSTKEKYCLTNNLGQAVEGTHDQMRVAHHLWKFGSKVNWDALDKEEYPFQWVVYDINNYIENM